MPVVDDISGTESAGCHSDDTIRVAFMPPVQNFALHAQGGGLRVQTEETVRCLQRLGVRAEIVLDYRRALRDQQYDLAHLMGPDTLDQADACSEAGLPYVISTVYYHQVPYRQSNFACNTHLMLSESKWAAIRYARWGEWPTCRRMAAIYHWLAWSKVHWSEEDAHRRVFGRARWLLPNCTFEYSLLHDAFGNILPPYSVIPNSVDDKVIYATRPREEREELLHKYGDRLPREPFVLEVGRVCRLKESLLVAQGAALLHMPVVFVGPVVEDGVRASCLVANPRALFIGTVPYHDVGFFFSRAAVHALPSRTETPGLVSLEAAANGCPVVAVKNGAVEEYLQDDVTWCTTLTPVGMATALRAALDRGPSASLLARIGNEYNWETTATKTLAVYRKVLGTSISSRLGSS